MFLKCIFLLTPLPEIPSELADTAERLVGPLNQNGSVPVHGIHIEANGNVIDGIYKRDPFRTWKDGDAIRYGQWKASDVNVP